MLAILGGYVDEETEETSSNSSKDSEEILSPSENYHDVPKTNKRTTDEVETVCRNLTGSTSPVVLRPGVPADNASTKSPNTVKGHAAYSEGVKTNFRYRCDRIKKFQELAEKRVESAEEKVHEGYKRQRRRKRRYQQQGEVSEDLDYPSKKPSTSPQSTGPVTSASSEAGTSVEKKWEALKEYIDVNSHISQGVDHGHLAPDRSGLEKRLDEALAEGDVERAEELSQELSTREFGCRIAKAANARDYMLWKTEREEEKAAKKRKKKKKLAWGFEVKNRWEMKANM